MDDLDPLHPDYELHKRYKTRLEFLNGYLRDVVIAADDPEEVEVHIEDEDGMRVYNIYVRWRDKTKDGGGANYLRGLPGASRFILAVEMFLLQMVEPTAVETDGSVFSLLVDPGKELMAAYDEIRENE